jgi:hypothetical protein
VGANVTPIDAATGLPSVEAMFDAVLDVEGAFCFWEQVPVLLPSLLDRLHGLVEAGKHGAPIIQHFLYFFFHFHTSFTFG